MTRLLIKLSGARAGYLADKLQNAGMVGSVKQQPDFSYIVDMGEVPDAGSPSDNDEARAWAQGLVENLKLDAQDEGVMVEVI